MSSGQLTIFQAIGQDNLSIDMVVSTLEREWIVMGSFTEHGGRGTL